MMLVRIGVGRDERCKVGCLMNRKVVCGIEIRRENGIIYDSAALGLTATFLRFTHPG